MWTEITRPDYERRGGRYASDMADREWALIAPFMPPHKTTWADVAACLVFAGLSHEEVEVLSDVPLMATM